MTTLPEEAVKAEVQLDPNAVIAAVRECARITAPEVTDAEFEAIRADNDPLYANTTRDMERAIRAYLSALPFLSVQVAVKKLEWTKGVVDIASPHPGMKYVACNTTPKGSWAWWLDHAPETRAVFTSEEAAKAAAQADYEARILSALEPSPRAQALEEAAQIVEVKLTQAMTGQTIVGRMLHSLDGKLIREIAAAIRSLSSPDHADAGKTAGVKLPTERVCIPDPHNTDARIVGFRIREGDDAWGETGLSEPIFWLNKLLTADAGKVEGCGHRWRIFEAACARGYWGIELEQASNDDEPILYPIKVHRDTLVRIVEAHNAALPSAPSEGAE